MLRQRCFGERCFGERCFGQRCFGQRCFGGSGSIGSGSTGTGSTGSGSTGTGSTGSGSTGSGSTGSGSTGTGSTGSGSTGSGSTGTGSTGSGSTGSGSTGSGSTGSGSTGSGSTGSGSTGSGSTGSGSTGSGSTGTGSTGSGSTGTGSTGSGSTGGVGTPPVGSLTSGLLDARLLYVNLLQVPIVNAASLNAESARVGLDANLRLESIGLCPGVLCLSRGTAQVTDAGGDSIASWGRWIDGAARVSVLFLGSSHDQSSRAGMHYLVGVPTLTMPTSGTASYQLAGATQPTFSDASRNPGIFSGTAVVQFGSGQTTRVALDAQASFAGDATYRFTTTGGLSNPGATNLTMTAPNAFRGTLDVQTPGAGNALGCTAGQSCRASVSGAFLGPEAARLGLGYSLSRDGASGTTINGVSVLRRNP